MSENTPRKPSAARQRQESRILRAAEQVFALKGFNGTAMDAVAQIAGISKQNIIYYFPSKDALYRRVLEDVLDLWVEKMTFDASPQAVPTTVIENYIRGKLELSRDYPNSSKVFANEVINGAPVLREYLVSHLKPQFEHDTALIKRWIKAGQIKPVDPEHLFFFIWASTQTYADFSSQIQLLLGKDSLEQDDFDRATQFLTTMVHNSLAPDQL